MTNHWQGRRFRMLFYHLHPSMERISTGLICVVPIYSVRMRRGHVGGGRLQNANLSFAHLEGSHLEYAQLAHACLEGAHLSHLELEQLNSFDVLGLLHGFDTNPTNFHLMTKLKNERKGGVAWKFDIGSVPIFGSTRFFVTRKPIIVETDMRNACLKGANLRGANMRGANWKTPIW